MKEEMTPDDWSDIENIISMLAPFYKKLYELMDEHNYDTGLAVQLSGLAYVNLCKLNKISEEDFKELNRKLVILSSFLLEKNSEHI